MDHSRKSFWPDRRGKAQGRSSVADLAAAGAGKLDGKTATACQRTCTCEPLSSRITEAIVCSLVRGSHPATPALIASRTKHSSFMVLFSSRVLGRRSCTISVTPLYKAPSAVPKTGMPTHDLRKEKTNEEGTGVFGDCCVSYVCSGADGRQRRETGTFAGAKVGASA